MWWKRSKKTREVPLAHYPATLASARDGRFLVAYLKAPEHARLECRNSAAELQWEIDLPGYDANHLVPFPLRVSRDGHAWVCEGPELIEVDPDGNVVRRVRLALDRGERIGTFVLLEEGFVVAIYRPGRGGDLTARLLRLDPSGGIARETELEANVISYHGVKRMDVASGKTRQLPAWRPESLQPAPWEPLLVTGDLVVVGYSDVHSGIGIRYGLSLETGKLYWKSPPGPIQHAAIAGPDRVLIGFQGYGAFETWLYERTGPSRKWPTHGYYVVDGDGDVRVIEMENVQPSQSQMVRLRQDGALMHGAKLPGYYTSDPVLTAGGRIVFWREGAVRVTDRNLNLKRLTDADGIAGDMVLDDDGLLSFALTRKEEPRSTTLCQVESGLGPSARGYWTAGEGNLRRNPVLV